MSRSSKRRWKDKEQRAKVGFRRSADQTMARLKRQTESKEDKKKGDK